MTIIVGLASLRVKRIVSSVSSIPEVQEPSPGTRADIEMDSNADTCCLGSNFIPLHFTQRVAEVFAYNDDLPPTTVPIVSGATAYECPKTNETFILIVNEGLYYGSRLNHSLLNPNQLRSYGNPVWDNPFDRERPFGIELAEVLIPFDTRGTKVLFKTRVPTQQEIEGCRKMHLTSKVHWNPHEVRLSEVNTGIKEDIECQDPRSNA